MRMLLPLVLAAILASNVGAGITASVYRADEKTPLPWTDPNVPDVYRDIMVGTRLTVFIESDRAEYSGGALLVPRDGEQNGLVSARGYREKDFVANFWDSCLEAAGDYPAVWERDMLEGRGVEFYTDFMPAEGRWFVFDYDAQRVGDCAVELYDYNQDFYAPTQVLLFTHVPSRDFDRDTVVNFADFAPLAAQWRQAAVPDPNLNGSPDLNADGLVDSFDVALFSAYWLERTDVNDPVADPNSLAGGL